MMRGASLSSQHPQAAKRAAAAAAAAAAAKRFVATGLSSAKGLENVGVYVEFTPANRAFSCLGKHQKQTVNNTCNEVSFFSEVSAAAAPG